MTLHEEIISILTDTGHGLTTKKLTDLVNERGNYKRKDGKKIEHSHVLGRVREFPKIFKLTKNGIDLFERKSSAISSERLDNSLMLNEVIQILEDNGEELTTKLLADEFNRRDRNLSAHGEPASAGNIFLIVKNNPDIFEIVGDRVSLKEWEESLTGTVEDFKYIIDHLAQQNKQEVLTARLSLSNFGIKNFKSYNERQFLKLKPITLLFGPNSSGKSSLIHSILYLKNAFETGELDTHYMKVSGDSVDLGGFRQLIHRKDSQRALEFTLDINLGDEQKRLKKTFPDTGRLIVNFEIRQPLVQKSKRKVVRVENEETIITEAPTDEFLPVGKPQVQRFEILTDNEPLINIGLKQNLVFRIDYLNTENNWFKKIIEALILANTTTGTFNPEDWNVIRDGLDVVINDMYSDNSEFIPKNLKKATAQQKESSDLLAPISKDNRESDLLKSISLYLPFSLNEMIEAVYNELDSQLKNLIYLGPVRSFPPRHLAFSGHQDPNRIAGGAEAWEMLRDSRELREKINNWLGSSQKLNTKYKIEVRKFIDPQSKEFEDQVTSAAEEIDFELTELSNWEGEGLIVEKVMEMVNKEDAIEGINDLVLIDQNSNTTVTHRDVGFGISQVIPVLATAYANKGKTILIEQPEIHLHPALQAELGSLMVESALGENKNTFILENHSETMMLRILRLIRDTTQKKDTGLPSITPDDVSLIFVENTKNGTILRNLRIDKMGKIIDPIPGGFFEEDFEELF